MKNYKKLIGLCLALVLFIAFIPMVSAEQEEKININKASLEELCKLDRIGKVYAERIIEYREKNGPFQKPEDIMKVRGIGQKTWEANKDRICVE